MGIVLKHLGLTRFLSLATIAGLPIVVAVGACPIRSPFCAPNLIMRDLGEQKATQLVLGGVWC